ncbi:PH domain-containing protein [Candidatus Nomurabacteria bacterium]|nr:PH domain-containing protein [Candidatus Nomurabacteria bacterium]
MGFLLLLVSFFVLSSKDTITLKLSTLISHSASLVAIKYFITGIFGISILLIIIGLIISWLSYISFEFTLGENAISVKRGILNKREISIPYRQIQNIDIEQSFNQKMMGISKMTILTAGNDYNDKKGESEGEFEVIQSDLAEKIKEYILEKANLQIIKNV